MNKKMFFWSISAALLLTGCSDTSNNDGDKALIKDYQETIESLKRENSDLQEQISQLTEKPDESSEHINNNNSSDDERFKAYELNEEAILTDDKGTDLYSLKIISATTNLTETSEFYTDGKPENTIEVTYEYKNYNMEKPFLISSQFMEAIDSNGLAGKNMSMMRGQTEVSIGRSARTTIWFVMNKPVTDEEEIEIEYINDFTLGFEGVLSFTVPLEK
jgi:hypothetical protein